MTKDRIGRIPGGLDRERPVLIAGPTASGKSALAMEIADHLGGTIVNADALQVYGDWRILTARPSAADEAALPHRLYGHVPGGAPYSVGHWLADLEPHLAGQPVIVGGTGLYFTALTGGLAEIPPVPADIRALADRRIRREGHQALAAALDAETAGRIDLRNPARVQRAWEVLEATGRGLAQWQDATGPARLPLGAAQPFVIGAGRDWLTPRIEARFDAMISAGALDEVRAVHDRWDPAQPWTRAIGAAPLMAHLRGEIPFETARAQAVVQTRQYAKRQRNWFRSRMAGWQWIDPAAG